MRNGQNLRACAVDGHSITSIRSGNPEGTSGKARSEVPLLDKYTVMIVEDATEVRQAMIALLRNEGYEVVGAADGLQAIDVLHRVLPDLLLLDINMPGIDGLRLLELVRADPRHENVPVMMLTANTDHKSLERAEQLGVKDYLVKGRICWKDAMARVRSCLTDEANVSPRSESE
jgi:CheY-like chemotaxis protein